MSSVESSKFEITLTELSSLMELRKEAAVEKINVEHGGLDGLCTKLQTNALNGLSNNKIELKMRQEAFGRNEIPSISSKSFLRLVWEALHDVTMIILLVAALISLALSFYKHSKPRISAHVSLLISYLLQTYKTLKNDQDYGNSLHDNGVVGDEAEQPASWIEGAAIMAAVIVVVLVTAFNDWSKEKQFRGLQSKIESVHKCSVIRDGLPMDIAIKDIVVGDIVRIKYGDLLPADGILLHGNDLKIDESSLTGESELVVKSPKSDPVLLAGTHVMEGSGRMVVIAVGLHSQTGKILALLGVSNTSELEADNGSNHTTLTTVTSNDFHHSLPHPHTSSSMNLNKMKSVLQEKLTRLAIQIGYIGFSAALATVLVLIIHFSINKYIVEGKHFEIADVSVFLDFVIIGVTILVTAVPEGLPLAITLALTYSIKKMMKDNNLVRHLDACETMGNATCICSDKTGTLTTNRMTVVQSFINGRFYTHNFPTWNELDIRTRDLLVEGIAVNSSYHSQVKNSLDSIAQKNQIGNKTECALLGFVLDLGQCYESVRIEFHEETLFKVFTFNSIRKSMMTIIRLKNGGYRLYAKGASEIILARCSFILGADGVVQLLTEDHILGIMDDVIQPMGSSGLRTIALAYKDFVSENMAENEAQLYDSMNWDNEQLLGQGMTAISVLGIQDPVRDGVPEAIARCQNAGVTVRMVTGDNIDTARSIAILCGILRPGEDFLILDSKEFNARIRDANGVVDQDKLDMIWPKLRVLARASPTDKYVLVSGIIESNCTKNREIVAVTGDGTNDAPALKKADVGFAMGIAGTDVAKEASDIILTDDNFASIVKAVMWGRNVYDSIAKFLQFQLTVNIIALTVSFVGACVVKDSPLQAVQMLWVNLIMDTLASLALATDIPTEELLKRKPYGRNKSLISRTMAKNIVGHVIYQLAVLMTLLFFAERFIPGVKNARNMPHDAPPSVHFTIIFNTFVLLTLFNEINCRRVHGERNVFKNLLANSIFCAIWTITLASQILIVQFGGPWVSTHPLNLLQWAICFAFGIGELIWGQVIATIPNNLVSSFSKFFKSDESNRSQEISSTFIDDHHEHIRQRIRGGFGASPLAQQSSPANETRRGKILWLRACTRLGTQIRVVHAFHSNLQPSHPSTLIGVNNIRNRRL